MQIKFGSQTIHRWFVLVLVILLFLFPISVNTAFAFDLGNKIGGLASSGKVWYVHDTAKGSKNGTSWTNAFIDLQKALDAASAGDEIWVAGGTYIPTTRSDVADIRSVTFNIRDGIALYGGFAGYENAQGSRNWTANPTILSGDIDHNDKANPAIYSDDIVGSNAYRIVTTNSVSDKTILDGFTITAGDNSGSPGSSYPCFGAGIFNFSGSPTLTNLTFSANRAAYGGGIYNNNGSPTINNAVFTRNVASFGGGIYSENGNMIIFTATFHDNYANDGGGMKAISGHPSLSNVTFQNNTGTLGGGLYNLSDITFSNVNFIGNTADYGGGLYNAWGLLLKDARFIGNRARYGGGLFNNSYTETTFSDLIFDGNSGGVGGGVYNENSRPNINNITFRGNSASEGGGMYNNNSTPAVVNVTFIENSALERGGGVFNYSSSPHFVNVTIYMNSATLDAGGGMYNQYSSTSIRNSILYNNTPNQVTNDSYSESNLQVSISDFMNGYPGTGNIDADPVLGGLGNYGGYTPTLPVLKGSPVVDTIPLANCTLADGITPLTYDQRGFVRPVGDKCDMGAVEGIILNTYLPVILK